MVTFNELRISEDGRCLIVDAEVSNLDIYKDMYIKSISLDYYENVSGSLPTSEAYVLYNNSNDDSSVKHKRVTLLEESIPMTHFGIGSFTDGLFFVTVTCDGALPSNIMNYPCGYDDTVKIGVIVDWKSFYTLGMQYAARLANGCADPCLEDAGFENFILQWNALKLAINTCNWPMVAQLWDRILCTRPKVPVGSVGGCGCRG